MAQVQTKAIVLSSLKYSDTSLIVKCFTLKDGLKTYLLKGILSSRKKKINAAYFQPLSQLIIEANHNSKGSLNSIKEVRIHNPYTTIPNQIFKQSIVLFLSEILSNTIQEEEANESLFVFVETALLWLDTHDDVSNFHLLFLIKLTKYLGFYPDTTNTNYNYFTLRQGVFVNTLIDKTTISKHDLFLFKKLLGINFEDMNTITFNKSERQQIIKVIIRYFELHLTGFRRPKSLHVLEAVFS